MGTKKSKGWINSARSRAAKRLLTAIDIEAMLDEELKLFDYIPQSQHDLLYFADCLLLRLLTRRHHCCHVYVQPDLKEYSINILIWRFDVTGRGTNQYRAVTRKLTFGIEKVEESSTSLNNVLGDMYPELSAYKMKVLRKLCIESGISQERCGYDDIVKIKAIKDGLDSRMKRTAVYLNNVERTIHDADPIASDNTIRSMISQYGLRYMEKTKFQEFVCIYKQWIKLGRHSPGNLSLKKLLERAGFKQTTTKHGEEK